MKILIPSRARPHVQPTADALLAAGVDFEIVRTETDTTVYPSKYPQIFAPREVTDIASKRNWIMSTHTGQKILVLDDDLSFCRVLDNRAFPAGPRDVENMILRAEQHLDRFAHLGVAKRFMINAQPRPFVINKKPKSINGYNLALFPDPVPQFRLKACSDIDYTMQLIQSGRSCIIMTDYCYTERDYMAPGGCSEWRTKQTIHEGMIKLEAFWPGYVRLRGGPEEPGGTLATIYLGKLARDYVAMPKIY